MKIPFNVPAIMGKEREYIEQCLKNRKVCGDGPFTKKCSDLMEEKFKAKKVLLTTSCSAALDMSGILTSLNPGDEVIMPSYTFSSTANAVCLRNAKPVFVDIRKDTLNIDENKIEESITEKTRAIIPVHYGGISCEMDIIKDIAKKHSLIIIEDAAQGVNAKYGGRYLGTIGDIGCYSFHETKNYTCGEGGAILINNEKYIERSEIVWEKGTDRGKVIRGEKDKYSWEDLGSSFLLSDLLAAFLYAQLQDKDSIQELRKKVYLRYLNGLKELEDKELIQMPVIPKKCHPNYHSFFILLKSEKRLNKFLQEMRKRNISAYIGYVPLHTSRMGLTFGYKEGDLPITEDISKRISRLPFYTDMSEEEQLYVIGNIKDVIIKMN